MPRDLLYMVIVYTMLSELVKPFLVGGTVIAGSKLLASYSTPAVASLLGGLPTGILTAFFMVINPSNTSGIS